LQWLEDFASAHGKQTAYSEWGVNTDKAGPYIALAAQWFATHDVAYQIYWDSNTDPVMQSQLDNGQYPKAAAAYLAAFGATNATAVDTSYNLDSSLIPTNVPGTDHGDQLSGHDGQDVIEGGAGNDTLTGGTGIDTFVFAKGSGKDVITDFGLGGEHDVIDISAYKDAGYKATVQDVGGDTVITFSTGDSITLVGVHVRDLVADGVGYHRQ